MRVLIILLGLLISCSSKNQHTEEYILNLGKEEVIKVGTSGLSSGVPFKFSNITNNESLIFNQFSRTIDTLFYGEGNFEIKRGISVPLDGPQLISDFSYFWTCGENSIFFLTLNSIVHWDLIYNEVEEISFLNYDIFNSSEYIAISKGNGFNFSYSAYDCISGNVYLAVKGKESKLAKIVQYNLYSKEVKILPIEINSEELNKHSIILPNGLEPINFPDLFLFDSLLVISFNYKGSYHVYDLRNNNEKLFRNISNLFPTQKLIPAINNGIDSPDEVIEAMKEWQNDVSFGSFGKFNEQLNFRIVRGAKKGNRGEYYLELFNKEFVKVYECNISDLKRELGGLIYPMMGRVWLTPMNQDNEDEIKLISLSLD